MRISLPKGNKIPYSLSFLLSLPLIYFTNSLRQLNADDVVPGLMSVENWTAFYWGQSRLGGFVPLISQPFTSLSQNLHFQNYLHVSLLLVFMVFTINQFSKLGIYLNYILLLMLAGISLVLWPHQFLGGLPYGDSFGLSAISALIAQKTRKTNWHFPTFILPLIIANWVNPLVTLYCIPIYLFYIISFTNQYFRVAIHFLVSLTFGIIFIVYGVNRGEISGLSYPSLQVFTNPQVVLPLALVQTATIVILIHNWMKGRFIFKKALLLLSSLTTWPLCIVISSINQVRINLYEPRYFIPVVFISLICNVVFISSEYAEASKKSNSEFGIYKKRISLGLLVLLLVINSVSFLGILKSVPLGKPWINVVPVAMDEYPKASFAMGDYWYAWPTKLFVEDPSIFPVLAYRMEGQKLFEGTNWNKLKSIIRKDSKGICFGSIVSCEEALHNYESIVKVPKNKRLKLVSESNLVFDEINVSYINLQQRDDTPSILRVEPMMEYFFSKTGDGISGLYAGWSEPETWGVWSVGHSSRLKISFPKQVSNDQSILFQGIQFPEGENNQRLEIWANGIVVGVHNFSKNSKTDSFRITIPSSIVNARSGVVTVKLNYSNPISPKSLNLSTDPRVLAFGLVSIKIE